MNRVLSATATVVTIVATVVWATSLAEQSKLEIVGLTADEVRCELRVRPSAHKAKRLGYTSVWKWREARAILQLHRYDLAQRAVEGSVAGCIREMCLNNRPSVRES